MTSFTSINFCGYNIARLCTLKLRFRRIEYYMKRIALWSLFWSLMIIPVLYVGKSIRQKFLVLTEREILVGQDLIDLVNKEWALRRIALSHAEAREVRRGESISSYYAILYLRCDETTKSFDSVANVVFSNDLSILPSRGKNESKSGMKPVSVERVAGLLEIGFLSREELIRRLGQSISKECSLRDVRSQWTYFIAISPWMISERNFYFAFESLPQGSFR